MADEEDSTRNNNNNNSSSSTNSTKELPDRDENGSGWLRLGIGCTHNSPNHKPTNRASSQDGSMLELNQLQGPILQRPPRPLFYYQPQHQHQHQQQQQQYNHFSSNYFRMMTPLIPNYPTTSGTGPATSFLVHHRPVVDPVVRLIDPPPRRPHSGLWFLLQPSLHQSKQPFLPQLPKNYLRIKDGRMTVRFLIKYLVNKLGLESESEVEIRCRGEQLEPSLTMQHVRDEIWSTNYVREAAAASTAAHNLMLLHYARSS